MAFICHSFMKRIGKAPQQKQVRRPADKISVIPGFRVKGNRTNRTGPFYYKSPEIVVHE